MVNALEQAFGDGFQMVTGDPIITALLFLGFFAAFTMLQGTRMEGKAVVLIPALFLSLIFAPIMLVVVVIVSAFIAYLALTRGTNR